MDAQTLFWKPAIPGDAKLTMIATAMPLSSLGEAEHIIDAALIAARAAALHAPPDPRFASLAEHSLLSTKSRPRPKRKSRASKAPRVRANASLAIPRPAASGV
jgi:hypothetical protein